METGKYRKGNGMFQSMLSALRKPLAAFLSGLLLVTSLTSCGAAVSDSFGATDGSKPAIKVEETSKPAIKVEPDEEKSVQSSPSEQGDTLKVRFLDVGQGDCALISCGGKNLLIDGGPREASSKIYSVLERLKIDHIDYVIVTHPDADHCGGVPGALSYATCGTFYCSTATSDTKTWDKALAKLDSQGVSVTVPSAGESFSLGSAVVTFLGPVQKSTEDNNNSIVLRIDHENHSFLFTGDAEEEEEQSMVSSGCDLDVDVLKVGHHGSSSSTGSGFLAEVTPEYAVVSVGSSNSYGHPTEQTLARLESSGAYLFRTDTDGDIIITSEKGLLTAENTKGTVDE